MYGLLIAHAGGEHEDAAREAFSSGAGNEVDGALRAEIDVEQDNRGLRRDRLIEGFGGGSCLAYDGEARLLFEHAGQAFAKHLVVVNQKNADFRITHSFALPPLRVR